MWIGEMLIQLFQIYYWSITPIFLENRNIELKNWPNDGSLTFTAPFLNKSRISWSTNKPSSWFILNGGGAHTWQGFKSTKGTW